ISHFGQELTDDVKRDLRLGDMINKFFTQLYQVTVPKDVQLAIFSLIMQDLISTKEDLEIIRKDLIAAFYDRGRQKLLHEISSTDDLKDFHKRVMERKQELLVSIQKK